MILMFDFFLAAGGGLCWASKGKWLALPGFSERALPPRAGSGGFYSTLSG